MEFTGFQPSDFAALTLDGLDARMKAIRERIQPKFKALGEALLDDVSVMAGTDMYVHIARHARRKVNPPRDTWLAIGPSKRGYKMDPHFQIGLFDDHAFIWLALIYELPAKREIAGRYLAHVRKTRSAVPADFVLSFDHMEKDHVRAGDLSEKQFKAALERFRDVKQAEFLIGRHLAADHPAVRDGRELIGIARSTFETLMPLYKLAIR